MPPRSMSPEFQISRDSQALYMCGLNWSTGQSTIDGRAREFGRGGQRMMNLWWLILIESNGEGHSPSDFKKSFGRSKTFRTSGGKAANTNGCYKHLAPSGAKAEWVSLASDLQLASRSLRLFFHFYQYQSAYSAAKRILRMDTFGDCSDVEFQT